MKKIENSCKTKNCCASAENKSEIVSTGNFVLKVLITLASLFLFAVGFKTTMVLLFAIAAFLAPIFFSILGFLLTLVWVIVNIVFMVGLFIVLLIGLYSILSGESVMNTTKDFLDGSIWKKMIHFYKNLCSCNKKNEMCGKDTCWKEKVKKEKNSNKKVEKAKEENKENETE